MSDPSTYPSAIGSEFQSLPLEYMISAPLKAAVTAQEAAALTTMNFVSSIKNDIISFSAKAQAGGAATEKGITVPLLTCVPVPHLRIDSLTINFKFEITQTDQSSEKTTEDLEGSAGVSGIPWLNLSIKGSLAHEASRQSTTNKSGLLDISVHASESDVPAGLQKVLDWLTSTIPAAQAK